MLTPERHQVIIEIINKDGFVKLKQLISLTDASESTIRRDLIELEEKGILKRVHGGAAKVQNKSEEQSIAEKSFKNVHNKKEIARFAAEMVKEDECIYIDAGSTTLEMIPYLKEKNITVVTNGLMHVEALHINNIKTYLLGGRMKGLTKALIGSAAIESLKNYRFDRAFIGSNGVHEKFGYTTPDPAEALVKKTAIELSQMSYILADNSKFSETFFASIGQLKDAIIITDSISSDLKENYKQQTTIIEVDNI